MDNGKLLKTGVAGTCVTAVCCFTPALVVLVSAVGLTAVIGWLDYVLLPGMAVFPAIAGYALYRRRRDGREGETRA